MMRVAFDHQIFACQSYGGISRYFCMLDHALHVHGLAETHVIAPQNRCHLLLESRHATPCLDIPAGKALAASRQEAAAQLQAIQPDLVHETYYTGFEAEWGDGPIVTTVHDMIHELMPQACHPSDRTAEHKRQAIQRIVEGQGSVICVSRNTRQDLLSLMNLPEEKVHVVHHGVQPPAEVAPYSNSRPYLLFVGHREGYKNFTGLIEAVAISRAGKDVEVICAGSMPFTAEEQDFIHQAKVRARHMECSDTELWALYSGAEALAYPSRYEGFGMPVLEAMSVGCPVIASNGSSLPEVAGAAALLVDTTSPEALAQALDVLIYDTDRRRDLIQAGYEQAGKFTWKTCAEQTAAIYRRTLMEHKA